MLGNVINAWHTSGVVLSELTEGSLPVETDAFHHEVKELASGNFLGLGVEVHTMESFSRARN